MATAAVEKHEPTEIATKPGPIIIDLGKKRRGQVRKLRRGEGALMDEVNQLVANLKTNGTMQSKDQPIIVVVREKRPRKLGLL
jgi:hypothetical protein